jgi:hypothetical protein
MLLKSIILAIGFITFSNFKEFEFDKNCLTIVINSLHANGAIRQDSEVCYIKFKDSKLSDAFIKKVNIGNKSLCLKRYNSKKTQDLITISSVTLKYNNKMAIDFTSYHSGEKFEGTVFLNIQDGNPKYMVYFMIKSVDCF